MKRKKFNWQKVQHTNVSSPSVFSCFTIGITLREGITLSDCNGSGTTEGLLGDSSGELLLLLFLSLFSAVFKLEVGIFESPEFGELDKSPLGCSALP